MLNNKDYNLLIELLGYNQIELLNKLYSLLEKFNYKSIIQTKDYLIGIGDIPIALTAHLDTVFEYGPRRNTILFDAQKQIMIDPIQGAGFDDRAGIFAIIKIIESGLKPHIIFTTDEEIGGIGADKLAAEGNPFPELKYIIELDRRGRNDCVFYDCHTLEFQHYIESFGFLTAIGSFSDISILCDAWQICGVNLSIGYLNEHSYIEMLFINSMFNTIEKVKRMLKTVSIPDFVWEGPVYIPRSAFASTHDYFLNNLGSYVCKKCSRRFPQSAVIAVQKKDGTGNVFYCDDCITGPDCGVNFCAYCDTPYEEDGGDLSTGICIKCATKLLKEKDKE